VLVVELVVDVLVLELVVDELVVVLAGTLTPQNCTFETSGCW
jgi:hypothetical protein